MEVPHKNLLLVMDRESEKRDSPFLNQTILRAGDKQDQFSIQTDEVTTPLNTIYSKYNGDFSCHGKAKSKNHAN